MDWVWRGDYSPATKGEYERTKDQLSREGRPQLAIEAEDGETQDFNSMNEREQASLVADRLKTYARKAYKRTKETKEENRTDIVCMRENDFYVDTVRQFRDRRYEYKKLNKKWKSKVAAAGDPVTKKDCEDKVVVYDSLQVAHKCILNSFYGYVMRKGARWRSMEMAGIVTKTGSDIITQARKLVEQIGRPLELDTDGIWCILPDSFPENYTFYTKDGSKLKLEYPCAMLNADIHDKFTNHQYQTLVDPDKGIYETRSECSIYFEVDGPYRCMVLPASTEEGKLLKKRYAVFNFDGSLAELKGFELKRRGELELIKTFQSQVFERFLDGNSLTECYDAVASVANHWIDVLDTRGDSLRDEELVDLISENRNMSRQLEDYGSQKGTSQTTARRLGEFLGMEYIKDKGLNCKFIIAEQPYGAPVTERAIPTNIWKTEPHVMKHFLRKWLKSPGLDGDGLDIRNVLDWDYYMDRFSNTIRKIITIPAALQKIPNPVPRVQHPAWLLSKVAQRSDRFQQKSIRDMLAPLPPGEKKKSLAAVGDIEDAGGSLANSKRPHVHVARSVRRRVVVAEEEERKGPRVALSSATFPSWLQQKKSTWRMARKERKDATRGQAGTLTKRQRTNVSVESFVKDAAKTLAEREWHIVEIREMSGYDSTARSQMSGSGDFVVWAIVGNDSLQKVHVSVPRTVYVSTFVEVEADMSVFQEFRKVDRHLPHSKQSKHVYEVTMLEHVYKENKWVSSITPKNGHDKSSRVFECVYESATPLRARILAHLGTTVRLSPTAAQGKFRKNFNLGDLGRVEKPADGEYLHKLLSYRRVFLYTRIHPTTKSGVVVLYTMQGGSGSFRAREDTGEKETEDDPTRPFLSEKGSFHVGAQCMIWIVRPVDKNPPRNISRKQCNTLFSQLLDTIHQASGEESDYACVSSESKIQVGDLKFENEENAFSGANNAINAFAKTATGPVVLLVNSSKSTLQLRRHFSTFSSVPVVQMPFPPGPTHNPSLSTLPALGWEQSAVQLSLEAYLFMSVVSFPKRVSYARYGHVPIGNLGDDENTAVFDVGMMRLSEKNLALSWANTMGRPDLGVDFVPTSDGGHFPISSGETNSYTQDDVWGDDNELVSPVIRKPGTYRSICVDVDIQDLAIAALTDIPDSAPTPGGAGDPSSPTSVAAFNSVDFGKLAVPLGDELATSSSLPMLRSLVGSWLRDAFNSNSLVADELLHHVYRLISSPDALLHDPALHRIVHSLMKSAFLRLLAELQRLGCTVVHASFHRITVATNKLQLADAEEFINFVISTARKRAAAESENGDALSKIALRPRQFHSHFVFLDEYNFGTMQLELVPVESISSECDILLQENGTNAVVGTVLSAWSIMDYFGSEMAQEYFRIIIGRFSRDPLKKQAELTSMDEGLPIAGMGESDALLLTYRQKMITKNFASYLTRAVSEIAKDGFDEATIPRHVSSNFKPVTPVLEFIKSVATVLELDTALDPEVQALKRSLLAQVGVAEYAKSAQWQNPAPTLVLPDVFCKECHERRDLNLFYLPPHEADEKVDSRWSCEDCGAFYDVNQIERRLIGMINRKTLRYQLQDTRCRKTKRVSTRLLTAPQESSSGLALDMSERELRYELNLLNNLARHHDLPQLEDIAASLLNNYR
jgi:DNA polymerase epsilon subunit 1